MNTNISDFLRTCSIEEAYRGNTELPAVAICSVIFEAAAAKPATDEVEARCKELFRHNMEFIKHIEERGATLYDELGNPVAHTHKIEDVLHALAATGQPHNGPILGGSGPRF